jgi:hypothetical protein
MFVTKTALSRRTFLRGAGATLALPFLDAMAPALRAQAPPPPRLGFVYVPNGVIPDQWIPSTLGAGFDLPPILAPLAPTASATICPISASAPSPASMACRQW